MEYVTGQNVNEWQLVFDTKLCEDELGLYMILAFGEEAGRCYHEDDFAIISGQVQKSTSRWKRF